MKPSPEKESPPGTLVSSVTLWIGPASGWHSQPFSSINSILLVAQNWCNSRNLPDCPPAHKTHIHIKPEQLSVCSHKKQRWSFQWLNGNVSSPDIWLVFQYLKKKKQKTLGAEVVVVWCTWDQVKGHFFLFLQESFGQALFLSLCPCLLSTSIHFSLIHAGLLIYDFLHLWHCLSVLMCTCTRTHTHFGQPLSIP